LDYVSRNLHLYQAQVYTAQMGPILLSKLRRRTSKKYCKR